MTDNVLLKKEEIQDNFYTDWFCLVEKIFRFP